MRKFLLMIAFLVGCGGRNTRIGIIDESAGDGGVVPLWDGGVVNQGECVNEVRQVPLERRIHIPPYETPVYHSNPPVSGEHWGDNWAAYSIHQTPVRRGYYVHNLEHGGVIFLYRPDVSPVLIDALRRVFMRIPEDPTCALQGIQHPRAVLTPDELLDVPWAVTVSGPENPNPTGPDDLGYGYVIKADCIKSEQALVEFAVTHRNRAAVEDLCLDGTGE